MPLMSLYISSINKKRDYCLQSNQELHQCTRVILVHEVKLNKMQWYLSLFIHLCIYLMVLSLVNYKNPGLH